MKLLLDTHVLLWALLDDSRLSAGQRQAIEVAELYVSAATVWEVGIKRALGKLDSPADLFETAAEVSCRPLPISWTHAAAAALPAHHADPFDRMLIAQAICEGTHLASSDRVFNSYDVNLMN